MIPLLQVTTNRPLSGGVHVLVAINYYILLLLLLGKSIWYSDAFSVVLRLTITGGPLMLCTVVVRTKNNC
jgi:hypothetical protein